MIATQVSPNKYDDFITSCADAVVHLSTERGIVRAELLRHRNKLPEETTFRLGQLLKAAKIGGAR